MKVLYMAHGHVVHLLVNGYCCTSMTRATDAMVILILKIFFAYTSNIFVIVKLFYSVFNGSLTYRDGVIMMA